MVSHASDAAFAVRFCKVMFKRSPLRGNCGAFVAGRFAQIPANREAISGLKGVAGDVGRITQGLLKLMLVFEHSE